MSKHPSMGEFDVDSAAVVQLEEAIRRNARVFEALLRHSQEGIVLVTPGMNVLRLIHPLTGYTESELVGRPFLSFIHPEDIASVNEGFSQLLNRQRQIFVCECRAMGRDGAWHWLELKMSDLLDDPDVGAILFNYRDVGQRKQFEEMAQCMNAYLACPEYAMFTQDRDGVILDWNAGAELAFGYNAEEIVGQNVAVLIPPALLYQEIAAQAKVAQGQDAPEYTTLRVRSDGKLVAVRIKLCAVPGRQARTIAQISHLVDGSE
jgi:PAS domain S-box-containing protein